MLHRLIILLVAALTVLIALNAAFADEPVFPKGSRIGLAPPGDLKPSTQFIGFEDPDRKVTIGILQLPLAAYEGLERSAFAQNQVGLTEVKRESFAFQSGFGFLITGKGEEKGVKVRKWFLVASAVNSQSTDFTTLIKVEVPDTASAIYSDTVIRKVLESVTFRVPPINEQLSMLPFKLKDLAGFRVMRVVLNDGVILIEGPSQDMIKNPYMIVSIGRGGPENPDDRARLARELLTSAPLRDIAVTLAEPIRIDGRPGYEVRATAMGFDGQPLALVQWLRFGGGGFLRVIGAVHKDNWDQLFPRFRQVRDSIEIE